MKVKVQKVSSTAQKDTFEVKVVEGESATKHKVSVEPSEVKRLGFDSSKALVKKSFEFLLAREPKESILSEFNLMDISKYLPEYEEKVKKV